MNINNVDYASRRDIRERAISYWQNQVVQNHLPPISQRKKHEMQVLKRQTSQSKMNSSKIMNTSLRQDLLSSMSLKRRSSEILQNTLQTTIGKKNTIYEAENKGSLHPPKRKLRVNRNALGTASAALGSMNLPNPLGTGTGMISS